jgi:hypothetical protein
MQVSIERKSGLGLVVTVRFTNTSDEAEYLALPRIEQEHMDGSYFQFAPARLAYLGIQVKRAPYTRDELRDVAPGESIEREIDLADLYDFTEAWPEQVRYSAVHPIHAGGTPDAVTSAWTRLGEPNVELAELFAP